MAQNNWHLRCNGVLTRIILFVTLACASCGVRISHPEFVHTRLAVVPVLTNGVFVHSSFTCPTNARIYATVVLPSDWTGEASIIPCQKPTFDFRVNMVICDSTRQQILNCEILTNMITYASWHTPRITMILYPEPSLYEVLKPGCLYDMHLRFSGDIPKQTPAEVYLDFVLESGE